MPKFRPLYFLLCFALVGSLFLGCDGRRDIRSYYFPARELTDGLVYVYENTGTLPGPDREYWYYLGVDVDTALYLSVTRYSPVLAPEQQGREEIRNDGVYLRELTLLGTDSAGLAIPTPTTLLFNQTFPFYLEDQPTKPYGYRMRLSPPDNPDAVTYVTLNRYFERDTTIEVLGGSYPALVFSLAGEVSVRDPEEGDISPQFTGYEIYAKGLGLVEYRRELGNGNSLGGRLAARMTMEAFLREEAEQ
ncbi:hypothetical protein QWY85_18325 [Neolewinella lacunae]|uniref:Uncharacterized protein n=1 Tax=Neolewinella lacunae TaxID=1517758 RepID=A0A923PRZ2_9BACT|nr:hypothetical protein [Neolewinella lacunae]MBC6995677.1 hypothetical protein [Neolewinella lacunae]MDN3636630.1 hypothetical protein [Neolewinella lacunae]